MEINNLFKGVYKGKRVFITGHTGFKGSWLAYWLIKLGADVTGYSLEPYTEPNHFSLLALKLNSIIGNINDQESLKTALIQADPEIIFHLAAQPIVRLSYEQPYETFLTNVMGTLNIFEIARSIKSLKAIVNITSDKCYENKEIKVGYKETDSLGGFDPYSASKGCSEILTSCYRKSFFTNSFNSKVLIASARAGNVIGGGDWALDRLIPDIVKSTSKNGVVQIRYPNAVRPWQHVLEPLSGYLLLGEVLLENKKEFAEAWNFGHGEDHHIKVIELIETIKKYWSSVSFEINTENQLHEASLLHLDNSKAKIQLNWSPVWDIDKTIDKTINWYKQFYLNKQVSTESDLYDYIQDAINKKVIWTVK